MKKRDLIILIIVAILTITVSVESVLLFTDKKENNVQQEDTSNQENNEKLPENNNKEEEGNLEDNEEKDESLDIDYNSEEYKIKTELESNLKSKGIYTSHLPILPPSYQELNFKNHKLKITSAHISDKKDTIDFTMTADGKEILKITSYYGNNYNVYDLFNYLLISFPTFSGKKIIIFDENLNIVLEENVDEAAEPIFSYLNESIYYGKGACEGERSDGTIGNVVEVYKFDTKTGKTTKEFNLDHNAGWKC